VGCCELAIRRAQDAGHKIQGALAASDSFFPFPDGPKTLIDADKDYFRYFRLRPRRGSPKTLSR